MLLPQDCVRQPNLVVVPLTTLSNWERELATWAPYLRVVSLKGSAAVRGLLLDHCFYAPVEAGSSSSKGKAGLQVGCRGDAGWVHRQPRLQSSLLNKCIQPEGAGAALTW